MSEKPKDNWDKAAILMSAMTPMAIFVAGLFISSAAEQASEQRERERASADALGAQNQLRVDQMDLAVRLLDPLASDDPRKRNMAREIMLSPIIPDGPKILAAISASPTVAAANPQSPPAENANALETKRKELLQSFYSADRDERVRAYRVIMTQWQSDPALLSALLDAANKRWSDADSILRTTSLALRFAPDVLLAHAKQLEDFIAKIPKSGDWKLTQEYAEKLKVRLKEAQPRA